jgi:hypothetical protein
MVTFRCAAIQLQNSGFGLDMMSDADKRLHSVPQAPMSKPHRTMGALPAHPVHRNVALWMSVESTTRAVPVAPWGTSHLHLRPE